QGFNARIFRGILSLVRGRQRWPPNRKLIYSGLIYPLKMSGNRLSEFPVLSAFAFRNSEFQTHSPFEVSGLACSHGSNRKHNTPNPTVIPPIVRKILDNLMLSINTNPEINTPAILPKVLAAMMKPLERPTCARLR